MKQGSRFTFTHFRLAVHNRSTRNWLHRNGQERARGPVNPPGGDMTGSGTKTASAFQASPDTTIEVGPREVKPGLWGLTSDTRRGATGDACFAKRRRQRGLVSSLTRCRFFALKVPRRAISRGRARCPGPQEKTSSSMSGSRPDATISLDPGRNRTRSRRSSAICSAE